METKSAVIGAGATVLIAGGLFFGIASVNAASGTTPTPSPSPSVTVTPTATPTPTQEPVVTETPAPVETPAPAPQPAPAPVQQPAPAPAPAPVVVQPAPAPVAPANKDGYITNGNPADGLAGPGKVDLSTPPADGSQVILNPKAGDVAQPAPSAGK